MICIIAHNKWKLFIGNSWNVILSAQTQQTVLTFSLFSSNSLPPLTRQTAVHAWLAMCENLFWLLEQSFHLFDAVWTTKPCYRMCKNPLNVKHPYLNVKLQNSNPYRCIKPNMDVSIGTILFPACLMRDTQLPRAINYSWCELGLPSLWEINRDCIASLVVTVVCYQISFFHLEEKWCVQLLCYVFPIHTAIYL